MNRIATSDLERTAAKVSLEDPEVIEAVNGFLTDLEEGKPVDRQQLIRCFPDIAKELTACLDGLDLLHRVAPQLQDSPEDAPDSDSARPIQPTATLGDFRIVREIGRGGMGVVYEAEQLSLGRRVALKVLPFAAMLDHRQLQRFKTEAHAAALLNHHNVVPVFGVGTDRGVHYYAMQYIEGQTLAVVISDLAGSDGNARGVAHSELPELPQKRTSGPQSGKPEDLDGDEPSTESVAATVDTKRLPSAAISTQRSTNSSAYFRTVAELGIQAAEALEHAHEEGVVHRDIKPSNLILDNRGKLWVTDFGLARIEADPGLTFTGDIVGTLRYMSPEQALAKRVIVDQRTDIYSLCATLYELLTLQPLFDGDDRQELIRQIAFEEPRPPRKVTPAVPAELETIVLKGIEKNPEHRYDSAQQLADDLRCFLDNRPIHAKRSSFWQRSAKWARRHPSLIGSGVAILAVIGLAMTASTVLLTRETRRVKEQSVRAEQAEANAKRAAATAEAINRFLTEYVLVKADPQNSSTAGQSTFRDALDDASQFADRWFPDEPQLKGALYQTIGKLYGRLGDYEKSEMHYRAAVELLRPSGGDDPVLLATMNGLGYALHQLGRSDEAERLLRQSLQMSRRVLGEESPTTLAAIQNLSLALLGQNRLPEAKVLTRQNWDARKQLLGRDDPDTAIAAVHFAKVLIAADNVPKAVELLSPAVDVLRQRRGTEDPETLGAMAQLAATRTYRGELDAAESLLQEILQARIRVQGANHSLTLAAMSDLADLLQTQGHLAEAESMFDQILTARQLKLGREHPETLAAVERFADVLWKQGKLPEAAEVYSSIRPVRTDASRELKTGPDTLQIANKYAIVLQGLGKHAEAERLLRENWNAARKTLGAEHPTAQASAIRLLISLYVQRRIADAEALVDENLGLLFRVPDEPESNASTGLPEALANRFFAYREPSAYTESLLRASLKYKRETLPAGHLSIATTLAALGRDLLMNNKLQEAEQLFRESRAIRAEALPNGNWLLAETESLLGSCLAELNRFDEAQPLVEQSFQKIADSPELKPALKLELLQRIVTLYDRWQKPAQASLWATQLEDQLRQCLQDYETSLPQSHTLVFDTQSRLGECLSALGRHHEAEPLLLHAYADQGVTLSWYQDPYSRESPGADLHSQETLRRIIELYESWQRPADASQWRELDSLHSNDGQAGTVECHQKGIEIWERLSQGDSETRYRIRLSRAYSDFGLALLRSNEPAESLDSFDKAIEILIRVLAVDEQNVVGREHLAACYLGQAETYIVSGNYPQVEICLHSSIEVVSVLRGSDRSAPALGSRGAFTVSREAPGRLALLLANCAEPGFRDLPRALQLAEDAHREAPENRVALLALGLARYRTGQLHAAIELLKPRQRSSSRLVLAMAYSKLGDQPGARFHYNTVARTRVAARSASSSTSIWWLRTEARLFDEASELLGVEANERQATETHALGISLAQKGDFHGAIDTFRAAIELKPIYPEAYFNLATCLKEIGDMEGAIAPLREAIRFKPDYADAHNNLGLALLQKGEFTAAVSAFEKSLQLDPDNARYQDNLARLLATCPDRDVRDPARAVELAKKATRLEPMVGDHWYTLGAALEQKCDFEAAVGAYGKSVELQPDDARPHNDLAWLLTTCRDPAVRNPGRAVDLARKATQLVPTAGSFWNTLGVSHYRNGNHQATVAALQKSVDLRKGGDAFDFFFLAMSHWKLAETGQARDWYSQAIAWMKQQSPDDQKLRQIRDEAAELLGMSPVEQE